jgi:hypothetical protein
VTVRTDSRYVNLQLSVWAAQRIITALKLSSSRVRFEGDDLLAEVLDQDATEVEKQCSRFF